MPPKEAADTCVAASSSGQAAVKTFGQLSVKQQRRNIDALGELLKGAGSMEDAVALLASSVQQLQQEWPEVLPKLQDALAKQSEPAGDNGCRVCTDVLTGLNNIGCSLPGYDTPNPPEQFHAATW